MDITAVGGRASFVKVLVERSCGTVMEVATQESAGGWRDRGEAKKQSRETPGRIAFDVPTVIGETELQDCMFIAKDIKASANKVDTVVVFDIAVESPTGLVRAMAVEAGYELFVVTEVHEGTITLVAKESGNSVHVTESDIEGVCDVSDEV